MIKSRIVLAVAASMLVSTGSALAAYANDGQTSAYGQSAVIGSVDSTVKLRNSSQQQSGQNNVQQADFGSVVGSAVVGDVKADVTAKNTSQTQSGMNNQQEMLMGTIQGSALKGSFTNKIDAKNTSQTQEGQENQQGMSAGSIR